MRHFTIEQAEALVPTLTTNIGRLRYLRQKMRLIDGARSALPGMVEAVDEDGARYCICKELGLNRDYHKLAHEFFTRLEHLIRIGVVVNDLDTGMVDFPHRLGARKVRLCWKLGEKRIGHWHDEGACGERQPMLDVDALLRR